MNEPVRIVADWLAGTTAGSTSVAAILALSDFPKDSADSLPSNPTHYDSTRDAFAARGELPRDGSVTFPCVVVGFGGIRYDSEAMKHTGDAKLEEGEVTVVITVAHRLQATAAGVEDIGYLVRAVKGSLTRLHQPNALSRSTRNGFSLLACTGCTITSVATEADDKWLGAELRLTYTTHETTPD